MKNRLVFHPSCPRGHWLVFLIALVCIPSQGQDEQSFFPGSIKEKANDVLKMSSLGRIIGGTTAKEGFFPYFVRIDDNAQNICGGSFIAPDIVLTAAHCFTDGLSVVVGGTTAIVIPNGPGVSRSIAEARPHPDFNEQTFQHDLMLLKLSEPVEGVEPVKIQLDGQIDVGDALTVVGLGNTVEDKESPAYLQQVTVNVVDFKPCAAIYSNLSFTDGIENFMSSEVQFCAAASGRDSCKGDSGKDYGSGQVLHTLIKLRFTSNLYLSQGGPILNDNGTQVGVVSFGFHCALKDYPGVYAKLLGAREWLLENICNMTAFPMEFCVKQSALPSSSPTIGDSLSNYPTMAMTLKDTVDSTFQGTNSIGDGTTPPGDKLTIPQTMENAVLCTDYDDQTFTVEGIEDEISCQWLRDRPLYRQSVCRKDNLAYLVCTLTCVQCLEGSTFEVVGDSPRIGDTDMVTTTFSRARDDESATLVKSRISDDEMDRETEIEKRGRDRGNNDPSYVDRTDRIADNKEHEERTHFLHGENPDDA